MRRFILSLLLGLGALCAASAAYAQVVFKAAMHSDVKVLDPIWSGDSV